MDRTSRKKFSHLPVGIEPAILVAFVFASTFGLAGCALTHSPDTFGNSGSLQLTTRSLSAGHTGQPYYDSLSASGGTLLYSWSISSGALPSGLSLGQATGIISGMPTQAGTFSFVVRVKDSASNTASANFSANVAAQAAPAVTGISPTSAPAAGGTSVTISGTNFQSGATVSFGGAAPSSVAVKSATQITVTTEAHPAGPTSVTVQDPNGESSTLTNAFTYNSATPTVSSVSPSTGPTTGGTQVQITGANLLAGAMVLFGGAQATFVAVNSATQISAVTPANAAGTVNVTVEVPGDAPGNAPNAFTYVAPAAQPTLSAVAPNSGPSGTSVTLTGTNFVSGATVAFGGSNATTQFVSATQITATVPNLSAGAVNAAVTNPDGSSATLNNGFTVTGAQQGALLTGCTVSAANTPSCTIPSGWTLVTTEGFENGSLGTGESLCNGMSIESGVSHSGSSALVGQYSGGDQQRCWSLSPSQINAREVYVSWYEFNESQGRINIDLWLGARWIYGAGGVPITDVDFNWNPGADPSDGGTGGAGACYTNCSLGQVVIFAEGTGGLPNFSQYNGKSVNPKWGSWVQYEMHIKMNDPNVSNGTMELYQNGVLIQSKYNANLIGGQEGANANIQIGGVYSSFVYYDDSANTQCSPSTRLGAYTVVYGNWNNQDACPNQAPPNPPGVVPIFKRYFDDIIVIKQ